MATHPGRRVALPQEPDSSGALIYRAANPEELHQREGAETQPLALPFLCKTLTLIPDICLYPSLQAQSSTIQACESQLMEPEWAFCPSPSY